MIEILFILVQISLWPELPIFDQKIIIPFLRNHAIAWSISKVLYASTQGLLLEYLEEQRSDKLHSLGNLRSWKKSRTSENGVLGAPCAIPRIHLIPESCVVVVLLNPEVFDLVLFVCFCFFLLLYLYRWSIYLWSCFFFLL